MQRYCNQGAILPEDAVSVSRHRVISAVAIVAESRACESLQPVARTEHWITFGPEKGSYEQDRLALAGWRGGKRSQLDAMRYSGENFGDELKACAIRAGMTVQWSDAVTRWAEPRVQWAARTANLVAAWAAEFQTGFWKRTSSQSETWRWALRNLPERLAGPSCTKPSSRLQITSNHQRQPST